MSAKARKKTKKPARKKAGGKVAKKATPRKKKRAKTKTVKRRPERRRAAPTPKNAGYEITCVRCGETVVCEEAEQWQSCECGMKYLWHPDLNRFAASGLNIYQIYELNGNRAGFWVHRDKWDWSTAAFIAYVQYKSEGRLYGKPPYYGNSKVWAVYFMSGQKRDESYLSCPGTYAYHWLLPGLDESHS